MEERQFQTHHERHSRRERGFTVLPVLAVCLALGLVLTGILTRSNRQISDQLRDRHRSETSNLRTKIEMLFFDSRACRQNLTANAFGTNLAQLASERVTVRYPSASGRAGDVLARRGSTLNGASVSAIRFSRPQGVPGTSRGYVSFLEIGLTSGGTGATSPARVPFYFVTNASNQLVDCWATTIPSPSSMPMATIEDATCRQLKGPGTVYNPATRTCIAVSTVAGP